MTTRLPTDNRAAVAMGMAAQPEGKHHRQIGVPTGAGVWPEHATGAVGQLLEHVGRKL